MRVGIVALLHESNTFLLRRTTLADFEQDLLLRGAAVGRLASSHHEVGGFFAGLAAAAIEPVPVFAARAVPSGIIRAEAWESLLRLLDAELDQAGPLDGLLVAPHGAAVSESAPDADGEWLQHVRRRLGTGLPIVGTLDPHANLSPRMVESTDALVAYRTNPHVDQRARGVEAATLIARHLHGDVRVTQAAAFPPLVINIERQRTDEPQCRAQYEFAEGLRETAGALSTSLVLGFPYADVAEMGSATLVVTDDDPALARGLARRWGEFLWSRRAEFRPQLTGIDAAMDFVQQHSGPVCLLDMGDNVGGGSPGDGTEIARALHERRIGPSFVCLCDPEAAAEARRLAVGTRTILGVGGKADDRHGPPLRTAFEIQRLFDGQFDEPDVRHGGIQSYDMGPTAIVRADSGLVVMLTTRRVPPFSLRQLTAAGIDPAGFRVLVAKGVHAPVAAYAPVCRQLLRVNTPGVTTADLDRLEYHQRRRPLFPFEPDASYP